MAREPDQVPTVHHVFPAALMSDVDVVLSIMPPEPRLRPVMSSRFVSIEGELIRLLVRIYSPEPPADVVTDLSDRQRIILSCLYSRHHDGYVRARYLPDIRGPESWLPHFVLQLIAEYVVEIGQAAFERIDAIPRQNYIALANENPDFMTLVRRRIVSYSQELGLTFVDSPGYKFLATLGLWDGHEARRLIRGPRLSEGASSPWAVDALRLRPP